MLTSIRIQNFRSIRDASVKLGQVNLFIGPNNSGKSNFLKGISLLSSLIESYPEIHSTSNSNFALMLRRVGENNTQRTINFAFKLSSDNAITHYLLFNGNSLELTNETYIPIMSQAEVPIEQRVESSSIAKSSFYKELNMLRADTKGATVYKPDPLRLKLSASIKPDLNLSHNGSDIVSFLFNLSQNHRKIYQKLEKDFAQCVGSLVQISTPVVTYKVSKEEKGKLEDTTVFKLKFFDQDNNAYWAEEVSEGVLYFLSILCIIHQPNPPKLLLLEEPEKGIHPRRIKEVIDFIFELARLRDVQVIITSHSPYVVDHFADIPECISVFDRENGETVIHNAADLIAKTNEEYAAQGLPPTKYKDSLGEYWVSGFLGGVPL